MTASKTLRMAAAIFLTTAVGSAWADEIADLRQQMAEMQAKLIKLEQNQTTQEQKIAAIKPGEMTLPESLKWVEKVKFYGDFRYRYEGISSESDGSGTDDVNRNRLRVRLGLTAQINDEMNFDMRIATGKSTDPISTNQTTGDSWTYKGIWLDRAYLTWKPSYADGLAVLLGKMGTPFYAVGKNQLIWDSDLNPEGIAAQYNLKMSDSLSMFANAGAFYVRMEDNDTDQIAMWGGQIGLTNKFNDDNKLTGGIGYYDYTSIKDRKVLATTTKDNGNSSYSIGSDKYYRYDYNLFETFAEYGTKVGSMPVSVYGDYVVNTASSVQEDTGWLVGTTLNKCKDPGSWEISYDYRDIEKDAVVGAFNDSDFVGGGTNGKGHRFGLTYQLAKNTQAGITYFLDKKANSSGKIDDSYNRLQVDVMVKF